MFKSIFAVSLLIMTMPQLSTASEKSVPLGQFSKGSLQGWQEKEFDGNTKYTLVKLKGINVLQASSQAAASGLFYEQRVDLNKTPWLNWSWMATSLYKNLNENEKNGDDFVARIYVVVDGGYFFWKTLALNYVWSSSHQAGEQWDNPFTSNAKMVAVEAGDTHVGQWRHYKRNVKQDLRAMMGKGAQYIDAIAIMTDSDNAKQQTTTFFGDIFFTAD